MRASWLVLLVLLAGCPLPDDTFFLSGRLVDRLGVVMGDHPFVLSRNRVASESRCDELEPLREGRTDEEGRFRVELLRQEITDGVAGRRFFALETSDGVQTLGWRFWFPDGDLELGDWQFPETAPSFDERLIDGHVAWRGNEVITFDRVAERRRVWSSRQWREVAIDSVGRVDYVPVETRAVAHITSWPAVQADYASRGGECPFIAVTPCPLTDGRYLPFALPADTRTLIFNFRRGVDLNTVLFHGLQLSGVPARAQFDFNLVLDLEQWNPLPPATLESSRAASSSEVCDEPGAFYALNYRSFIDPVTLRVRFVDGQGNVLNVLSLQEVTLR